MTSALRALSAMSLAASMVAAQQFPGYSDAPDHPVIFSLSGEERTLSGSGGQFFMQRIRATNLAIVDPAPGASAEKLLSAASFNSMMGDTDGDAALSDSVGDAAPWDAIVRVRTAVPGANPAEGNAVEGPLNGRNIFVSPDRDVATAVSGAPGLRRGDIGAFVRDEFGNDGQVRYFLRAEHVRASFGLPSLNFNIDAATQDDAGNIYLSLDTSVTISTVLGVFLVEDGAILMIPAGSITYDALGLVASTIPGRGVQLIPEASVDLMVAHSLVADHTGMSVNFIGDLDALEVHAGGATNVYQVGGQLITLPALVFGGTNLTGCGLVTTAGNGLIYRTGGVPMAAPIGSMTSGAQIGLDPAHVVDRGVQGLLFEPACRFLLGSEPAGSDIGISLQVEPSLAASGMGFLAIGFLSPGVPLVPETIGIGGVCHPDLYVDATTAVLLSIPPGDWASGSAEVFLAVPPGVSGFKLMTQAFALTFSGELHLSHGRVIER